MEFDNKPINLTIFIEAGFNQSISYIDDDGAVIDLSGYTAKMDIRKTRNSEEAVVSIDTDEGITITGSTGKIDIAITPDMLAEVEEGNYVYDLFLITGGVPESSPVIFGNILIAHSVTKGMVA
jgi:hypothetical protein